MQSDKLQAPPTTEPSFRPAAPPPSCFNEHLAIGEFDLWAIVVLLGNLLMGQYYLPSGEFFFF
jgi:hypothetical protein